MKVLKIKAILIFTFIICQISFAQKLTLNDIENICNKANWENVNQFLMNKNWEYYESEKGNSDKYSTITWSYNKSYDDKSEAWFYLYTYEGYPNKISYSVFNKPSYVAIQKSLNSKGYKLDKSEIEDNELISTYSNRKFILKITTEKRDKSKSSYYDESLTAYRFLLIKKSSVYDPDNGKKTDYYYGNVKNAEYTLSNGKMNGALKVYHENGQLKKTGYYQNGLAKGKFIEYDEDGNKSYEYTMLNDMKNGVLKAFDSDRISYTLSYKNDKKNGKKIKYYYDEESGKLNFKKTGSYLNDKKDGAWKLIYLDEESKEKTLTIQNYSEGLKNGFSQEIQGDTLIRTNYVNGKLKGNYNLYRDINKMFFGGVINTDTTELILFSQGKFINDKKSGYWKNYSVTKSLTSEGVYINGAKKGEWKYYYSKYTDSKNDKPLPYSEKLFLIENFENGKLNGLSKRFSYLNKEKYSCDVLDENNQPVDSCFRMVQEKVFEKLVYKDDKLHGPYELKDSLNTLVSKGNYKNELRSGHWIQRYTNNENKDKPYSYYQEGSYVNGKREGKWILYYKKGVINKSFHYSNDKLNGAFKEWYNDGKLKEIKQFSYGVFKELVTYDSLGNHPKRKFEIFEESSYKIKCRLTNYYPEGKTSQVYWVKKENEQINHHWFELSFMLDLRSNNDSNIYKDGEFKVFNSDDKPIIIGNYYKENRIGKWTYNYDQQRVKLEINYDENMILNEKYFTTDGNLFSGDFTYNNDDGKVKEVRSIKNGLRNGKTVFIDIATGDVIKKIKYKEGKIK